MDGDLTAETARVNQERAGMDCEYRVLEGKHYTALINAGLNETDDDVCIITDAGVMSYDWLREMHDAVHEREALSVWFAGPSMQCATAPQNRGRKGDKRRPRVVDHVSGYCLYVTRDAIEQIGGMDEHFRRYAADVDWQWRAQQSGGRALWVPGVWCERQDTEKNEEALEHDQQVLKAKWPHKAGGGRPKVFGIGLSKTGTSSLAEAMAQLGLRTKHYPWPTQVLREAQQFDVLTDTPVVTHYKELDAIYPNARFILTVRDMDDWLDSCEKHWQRTRPRGEQLRHRTRVMGTQVFHRDAFRAVYEAHIADVKAHFYTRPDKLLVMDVVGGDGWDVLCPFLGLPMPDKPFPHVNVAPEGQKA